MDSDHDLWRIISSSRNLQYCELVWPVIIGGLIIWILYWCLERSIYGCNGSIIYFDIVLSFIIFGHGSLPAGCKWWINFRSSWWTCSCHAIIMAATDQWSHKRSKERKQHGQVWSFMDWSAAGCMWSVWGISIFTGESDIAQIMVKAGLGIAGLLIIVFSP